MKSLFPLLAMVVFIGLLASCTLPKYPIDAPPSVKIDARLLGKWKGKNKGETRDLYTLTKKSDYLYSIEGKQSGNKKKELLTAYLSMVDSVRFLNVWDNDDTAKSYLFLRLLEINAEGNKLRVCAVSDSNMQYLTSCAQVREYIVNHLNNPEFYGDTVWFSKVK
jgi:hypothetical protein